MTLVTTILFGLVYPLFIMGVAQLIFPEQANGQLVRRADGTIVGSRLIGQPFVSSGYFYSRPSAAGYDAAASGGSNLGRTNKKLIERVRADVERSQKDNPGRQVPIDLRTTLALGLSIPHISPAAAEFQVPRVARERRITEEQLRRIVATHTEERQFGLLGEPRVNELPLNLALDEQVAISPLKP